MSEHAPAWATSHASFRRELGADECGELEVESLYEQTEGGLLVPRPRRARRRLRGCDLFCGCGGFSLGMQEAGINMVAAVEWLPEPIVTYLSNLGSWDGCAVGYVTDDDRERFHKKLKKMKETTSSNWIGRHNPRRDGSGTRAMVMGDASKVTGDFIRETLAGIGEPGEIDVVCGGPPCQGMSKMGKQKPDDPRNNLVLEFVRIADELGAETFVMENVPPLVTDNKFRPLFDAVVERAHAGGFSVVANVLDAANYGVPQFRRRAFIVGQRGDSARRPFSFPMPTNWMFVSDPGRQATRTRMSGERRDFRDIDDEQDDQLQTELPL